MPIWLCPMKYEDIPVLSHHFERFLFHVGYWWFAVHRYNNFKTFFFFFYIAGKLSLSINHWISHHQSSKWNSNKDCGVWCHRVNSLSLFWIRYKMKVKLGWNHWNWYEIILFCCFRDGYLEHEFIFMMFSLVSGEALHQVIRCYKIWKNEP